MQYEIEDKYFINDAGNQVKYKRLVITGYLDGNIETLELPISKDQAIIYRAMKNEGSSVNARKATAEESPEVKRKENDDKLDLFD